MHRFILIISSLIFPLLLPAQGINFFEGSFDEVKTEAKKQNKIIFIDCYTSWCGPCKWMAKNVFTDPKVGEFYNTNFVCYKMDMEKGDGKEVRKIYGVNAFPTLLYINGNGEIENRSLGACDTAEFIRIGKKTLDRENNFGALLRNYKNGDRTADFLYKFGIACANINVPFDSKEYFVTQQESELLSEKNFIMMEWYLTDIQSREFIFLTSHRKEFSELLNTDRVDGRIIEILRKNLVVSASQNKNLSIPETSLDLIRPLNFSDSTAFNLKVVMHFFSSGKNRDWNEYGIYSEKYINLIGLDKIPLPELSKIVLNISYNSLDTSFLKKVLVWAKPLVKNEFKLPETYLQLAVTYRKFFDVATSRLYAEKALAEEQKKTNPVTKDILKFIKELDELESKK